MGDEKLQYVKDANQQVISIGGVPIIDLANSDLRNKDLKFGQAEVTAIEEFGESGDVFDHLLWRPTMAALWAVPSVRNSILGLGSTVLLRGQQLRNANKGVAKNFRISLPALGSDQRLVDGTDYFHGLAYINIPINFATDQSRIGAHELTLERFKCLLRTWMAPHLVKVKRFPAPTEAIGYASMVRSLIEFREKTLAVGGDDEKMWKMVTTVYPALDAIMSPIAAAAGCFSSKEIYEADEKDIPGCIFWSGAHAMMTDASNKLKAAYAPAEKRTLLENSSFFPDFKRKMAARNITIVQTKAFQNFLTAMSTPIARFLNSSSAMSGEEARILDTILEKSRTIISTAEAAAITAPADEEAGGITGATAAAIERSQQEYLKQVLAGEAAHLKGTAAAAARRADTAAASTSKK